MDPRLETSVFRTKRRRRFGHRDTDTRGRKSRGGDKSSCVLSQGLPASTRRWEEARASASLEGARPYGHLDFSLLASGSAREYTSVVVSHSAGDNLQPQDANTGTKATE